MSDLPEPISDQDLLLHNIAVGSPDISDLEPNSRQEEYLKYIALNGTSGGGGGGSSVNVVQERGESTTAVMSQNAVSKLTIFGDIAEGSEISPSSANIIIGKNAYTKAFDNVTIGNNANVLGVDNIGIGRSCVCANENSTYHGCIAIGNEAQSTNDYAISLGKGASSKGSYGIAIGASTQSGSTSITIGKNAYAMNGGNIAIGANSTTNNDSSMAIGYNCKCNGGNSVAIGYNSSITTDGTMGDNAESVAIGYQVKTLDYQCIAVGTYAQALGGNSMALGQGAIARDTQGLAIGYDAQTDENALKAVAIGFSSRATESNTVSVGNETQKRRIVNVGTPVADSDAATKSYVDNALAARSTNAISALSEETAPISYTGSIVLYESQEGTQQDITLSDSPSNYEYMEIYFHNDLSQYNSVKVINPTNKYISLGIISYSNNRIVVECAEVKVTQDCIIWQDNHVGEQTLSPENIVTTTNNYIYIDKVVGYPK